MGHQMAAELVESKVAKMVDVKADNWVEQRVLPTE